MYHIIATGSTGNSILYHDSILVDCGVPYASIKPFVGRLRLVLLTHEHFDHLNAKTIERLAKERPTLRFGCGEWLVDKFNAKNVDVYEVGKTYDYGSFQICPVKLYHDVPNFGYRIFKGQIKIFHATDTAHLEGISAKDYDLYSIEHNYNEETVFDRIAEKELSGKFAYQKGSVNTHLSEQQARDFIFNNRKESSQVLRLHESKSF